MTNLLPDTSGNLTFTQYILSDFWSGGVDDDGFPVLRASVATQLGVPYELEFNLAANLSADVESVQIEVLYNGEIIGSFVHDGALFATYTFSFDGTGDEGVLEFRVLGASSDSAGGLDTSGVVPSYEKTVTFMGQEITVDAFAPGQSAVYQVLNGQLVKFDLETRTYSETEYENTFKINAVGYDISQDLIFGLARASGTDALGIQIANTDIVAIDARGATYKVAETPYGHYIGVMDGNGYLWTFPGNLGQAVRYDLSTIDDHGNLTIDVYDIDASGINTRGLADLAFNPETQTFYGVSHGGYNGAPGTLVEVDVSKVSLGGEITLTSSAIVGTIVDGVVKAGIPKSAYGATMTDADGNIYAGANNADHDLDSTTAKTGGFYKIVTRDDGQYYFELLAAAPVSSSNDGAMDTRGVDPFLGIDTSSTVLLREPILSVAIAEDDEVYLTAKGIGRSIDLLANDSETGGLNFMVTQINGIAVTTGMEIMLGTGETVLYNGDGSVTVTPGIEHGNVSASLTYTIENDFGVKDTATLLIGTSPVDGTAGNDNINIGWKDIDGNQVDGKDGASEIIFGYGGNDKIFSGNGNDDIYGGAGNDNMRGQAGSDVLIGGTGNDYLDGGSGADTMDGGAGNDVYWVSEAADVVIETGGGRDKVKSDIDYTIADTIEDLWLNKGTVAISATGNELDNTLRGNGNDNIVEGLGGRDILSGMDGNDTLNGGAGDDRLYAGSGNDVLDGGSGRDKLYGQSGSNILIGGSGKDQLSAGNGGDTLIGGVDDDLCGGGAGADTFVFAVGDGIDTIKHFEIGKDVLQFDDMELSNVIITAASWGIGIRYGDSDRITMRGVTSDDEITLETLIFSDDLFL